MGRKSSTVLVRAVKRGAAKKFFSERLIFLGDKLIADVCSNLNDYFCDNNIFRSTVNKFSSETQYLVKEWCGPEIRGMLIWIYDMLSNLISKNMSHILALDLFRHAYRRITGWYAC